MHTAIQSHFRMTSEVSDRQRGKKVQRLLVTVNIVIVDTEVEVFQTSPFHVLFNPL